MIKVHFAAVDQTLSDPVLGEYHTYGIAMLDSDNQPVKIISDISTDCAKILRMTRCFNQHGLSPIHLLDAILDFLEE